jgi:hypothetical protein
MANIKNFGLIGVANDVQFGKAGPRVMNASGAFQFRDAAGTAFADVTAKELVADALSASNGKIIAVDATGKLVAGALNAADLASQTFVTDAVATEAGLRETADETLQDAIDAEVLARGLAVTAVADDLADEVIARGLAVTAVADDLAQEVIDRTAADALKLSLSGGTMTGDLILSSTPTNAALGAVTKNYVDSLAGGLSWQESVDGIGAELPLTAAAGDRFINTTDGKIYTATAVDTWDAGVTPADGWASFSTVDETGYVFSGSVWTQFTGTGQITAGLGLKKTGNRIDVELSSTGGVTFTPNETDEGSVLSLKLDGATLSMGADGLRIAADVMTELSTATSDIAALEIDLAALSDAADAHALAEASARDAAILVETNRATDAEEAIQLELDATQTGAGLETSGAYAADATTNYLTAATSLKNADFLLDAALKALADDVDALGSGSITDLQDEVNAMETSLGLNGDGTLPSFAESNYLAESSSFYLALMQLDTTIANQATSQENFASNLFTAVGLTSEGELPDLTETTYLDAATSVVGSLILLDLAVSNLDASLGNLTTSNVAEGTNLYFTNDRARDAISVAGVGVSYDDATGVITSNATAAGVVADTIVSRGVDGAVEVGALTAVSGTFSSLTAGSMVFAGTAGLLSTDGDLSYNAATNVLTITSGHFASADAPTADEHLTNKEYVDGAIASAIGDASVNTAHGIVASFSGVANVSLGMVTGFVHRVKVYITTGAGAGTDVQVGTTGTPNQLVTTADVDSSVTGVYVIEVGQNYATATELFIDSALAGVAGTVVVEYI